MFNSSRGSQTLTTQIRNGNESSAQEIVPECVEQIIQNTPTSMNTDISILIITLPLPSTSISISPAETWVHTSRVYHIHVYFVHQYIVCIREQSVRVFLYILLNRVCVLMWFVERWAMNAVNCASSTEWVVSTHNKASYLCFLN